MSALDLSITLRAVPHTSDCQPSHGVPKWCDYTRISDQVGHAMPKGALFARRIYDILVYTLHEDDREQEISLDFNFSVRPWGVGCENAFAYFPSNLTGERRYAICLTRSDQAVIAVAAEHFVQGETPLVFTMLCNFNGPCVPAVSLSTAPKNPGRLRMYEALEMLGKAGVNAKIAFSGEGHLRLEVYHENGEASYYDSNKFPTVDALLETIAIESAAVPFPVIISHCDLQLYALSLGEKFELQFVHIRNDGSLDAFSVICSPETVFPQGKNTIMFRCVYELGIIGYAQTLPGCPPSLGKLELPKARFAAVKCILGENPKQMRECLQSLEALPETRPQSLVFRDGQLVKN